MIKIKYMMFIKKLIKSILCEMLVHDPWLFLLQSFIDVQKLVKYQKENEVILVDCYTEQHKTLLKYSPPQNAWAFTACD